MAKANYALIAPVGEVWKTIRETKPNINLYADNVHPNHTGTYLAACVFYAVLFNRPSIDSYVPGHVDSITAQSIQEVVDEIVLTQKWDWRK